MAVVTLQPKQVSELVNKATKQVIGETTVLEEDLTNVVDVGVALANANAYENFVYGLSLEIAKTIYAERKYESQAPNLYRDNYEYGQIVRKVRGEIPEAVDNQSWQVQDGVSYDDNVFLGKKISTKLFFNQTAWEIRDSVLNEQIKNAFKNARELGNFVSMCYTNIQNALTIKGDALVMLTINNFTAEVMNGNKETRKINLLAMYKTIHADSTLTPETAMYDKEFLRYATGIIKKYQKAMQKASKLFNSGNFVTFTPKDKMHMVLLDLFASNVDTYLESDTFHNEFTALPYHETVDSWQGTGTNLAFDSISRINVTTSAGNQVNKTGIIGLLFDHDACGLMKDKPEVETKYVRSAQFTNYWYKQVAHYFNDLDENFIVFYVGD